MGTRSASSAGCWVNFGEKAPVASSTGNISISYRLGVVGPDILMDADAVLRMGSGFRPVNSAGKRGIAKALK